jgi:hypothetical protein
MEGSAPDAHGTTQMDGSARWRLGIRHPTAAAAGQLRKGISMKFKLGLLFGGAIGYLIGSGKAEELWNRFRLDESPTGSTVVTTFEEVGVESPMAG